MHEVEYSFREKYIRRLYQRYFCKTEVPSVGKAMPVIAAGQSEGYIYELDNGVFFDANTRKIRKGDFSVTMTTETAELLKLFACVEYYKLIIDEMEKKCGVQRSVA